MEKEGRGGGGGKGRQREEEGKQVKGEGVGEWRKWSMYDRGATPSECKVLYLQAASCTFLFGSRIRFNSCVKHKHSKTNCVVLLHRVKVKLKNAPCCLYGNQHQSDCSYICSFMETVLS